LLLSARFGSVSWHRYSPACLQGPARCVNLHEFKSLTSRRGQRCRAAVLGGADDPWWPRAHHDRCDAMLPRDCTAYDASLSHACVVEPRQSGIAARWTVQWARAALLRNSPPKVAPVNPCVPAPLIETNSPPLPGAARCESKLTS
jgi:hypothetical protein